MPEIVKDTRMRLFRKYLPILPSSITIVKLSHFSLDGQNVGEKGFALTLVMVSPKLLREFEIINKKGINTTIVPQIGIE